MKNISIRTGQNSMNKIGVRALHFICVPYNNRQTIFNVRPD